MAKAKEKFTVSRSAVVEAARSFLGWKYRHQARGEDNSVDCVGLLVLLGEKLNIPNIEDLENYRRVPSASVLLDYLKRNLKEIPLDKIKVGSIVLTKMGGLKPRHTGIITNLETDLIAGVQPSMVHALSNGAIQSVVESPVKLFKSGFTNAFDIRGIKAK